MSTLTPEQIDQLKSLSPDQLKILLNSQPTLVVPNADERLSKLADAVNDAQLDYQVLTEYLKDRQNRIASIVNYESKLLKITHDEYHRLKLLAEAYDDYLKKNK